MTRWFGLPLVALLSACNVASVREAPNTIAYNKCESSAECGGGICTSDGKCLSRNPTFQKVLFEVTPPADHSPLAGVQYLISKDDLLDNDDASLELAPVSQVTGKVTAMKRKCDLQFVNETGNVVMTKDASLPAVVSLVPATTTFGLYSPSVGAQSKLINSVYWGYSVNVPPGIYDIYIEPNKQLDDTCVVPPQLVRGQEIKFGAAQLDIDLPNPSMFDFHVTWPPEAGSLDRWTVDMLDPESGRVISNRVPLTLASATDYRATLSYSSVNVAGQDTPAQQDPLLRLSPPPDAPDSLALPTVLMARSALAVFDATSGTLADFKSLPSPVHVHGQVTSMDTPLPVAATVTLVAKTLPDIAPGVLASFVRTVSANDDGQFDVYLLPGEYTVSTVPESSLDQTDSAGVTLAADTRSWTVPSMPYEQAGKVIELGSAGHVYGEVFAPNGPVAMAQVQAVASPQSIRDNALQDTLDSATTSKLRAAFIPRASASGVSSTGNFDLKTDPGTFDITVRPNADTGFAWMVLPNVPVAANTGIGLSRLNMPLPVAYGGTVTVPGAEGPKVIPSALVRAYVYIKGGDYTADSDQADSVLQVAETRAGSNGEFTILIPAELNHPPE